MKRNISPLTAALVVAGILVVLGGLFILQNRNAAAYAKETADRGVQRGQMMMGAQQGGTNTAEMMKRMSSQPH